ADDGAGVTSGGSVSLAKSWIGSAANADCEGITNGGNVTLTESTVSGCTDGITTSGNVTVTNSTVANATANGIITGNTVTMSFASIIHNGTGVHANGLVSNASVIAKSTTADCVLVATTSQGYNFGGGATCGFNQSTDRNNAGDPRLGSLRSNGGPTPTMLPAASSPLVNKIPKFQCSKTNDQRGVTRPQGTNCDIGAVEINAIQGYRLGEINGGIANFGNAQNHGSLPSQGVTPGSRVVGIAGNATGYRLAGADGSILAFGNAAFHGSLPSLGVHPTKPIVGIAA